MCGGGASMVWLASRLLLPVFSSPPTPQFADRSPPALQAVDPAALLAASMGRPLPNAAGQAYPAPALPGLGLQL